jgi:hypothetical protein
MNRPAFHPARVAFLSVAIVTMAMLAAVGQSPTPIPGKVEQMSIPVVPPRITPPSTDELKPNQPNPSAIPRGHIWSAVLIANNVAKPKDPPPELRPIAARLKRVFGYNQFEIAGEDEAPIADGAERKLTPSRAFWIDLKARKASIKEARGGYLLNMRLYQNEKPIVDTVALIAPESPLFFRGPLHAKGQIIIALQFEP